MNKKVQTEKTYAYQASSPGQSSSAGSSPNEAMLRKLIQEELSKARGSMGSEKQAPRGGSTECSEGSSAPSYPASASAVPTNGAQGSSSNGSASSSHGSAASGVKAKTKDMNGSSATHQSPGSSASAPPPPTEQYPMSLLMEVYREDRAREIAMESKNSESASMHTNAGMQASPSANPHQSDSSTVPITENKEFAPSFGEQPRNGVAGLEVISVPEDYSIRPGSVPESAKVAIPLPAHLGSYGTAKDRHLARLSCCGHAPASESIMLEVVQGTDDRTRVGNTDEYPWCCICSLLITAADNSMFIGTGWLVAPRVVLTAGHCVHMKNHGGWAKRIEVIPGRDATERPFGSAVTSALRSVRGWTIDGNRDFDYGAILLPEDRAYGRQLGWFGYAARDDDHFDNITLNLSGYPGDKFGSESGTQWFHSQGIRSVQDRQLTYMIDTAGGQSGAPVWEMSADGSRYGVGIHTWGMSSFSNGATRITGDVFDNIVSWVGDAP